MSATDDPTRVQEPAGEPVTCPRCGAPLRPDQDWCLNCGSAVTTDVAGARGWRTPVAIVGVVLLLAAAGLAFAFLEISGDADRTAQAPPVTPTPATTPPPQPTPTPTPTITPTPTPTPAGATGATGPTGPGTAPVPEIPGDATPAPTTSPSPNTTPTPTPGSGGVADWPAGTEAWTVILFSGTARKEAEDKARSFQSQGKSVGVLHSDDYSSLRAGYWVVFSGQYDGRAQAQDAAEGFGSTAPGAYARKVTPK